MEIFKAVRSNIKNNLLSGLIVVVPLVISLVVFKWLIDFFDELVYPIVQNYIHIYIPGFGILISIIFIYLAGLFTTNYFGLKLIRVGEWIVVRIPVLKTIYFAVKQVVTTLTNQEKNQTQKVVLIEYPRKGVYSVGLFNGQITEPETGSILGAVLIITSINPASGFTVLVPIQEIRFTNLPVEQAMKLIVSGGLVLPEKFKYVSHGQQ